MKRGGDRLSTAYERIQFTPEQMEYDPDEWLVPAQDAKGHSESLVFRVPPGMVHDLEVILQHRRFPYHTRADPIRHALLRHIKWLSLLEPKIPLQFLGALQMLQDMVTADLYRIEAEKVFIGMAQAIERMLNSGDLGDAVLMAAKARGHLQRMPEGPSKRRCQAAFGDKFAPLLSEGGGSVVIVGADTRQIAAPEDEVLDAEFTAEDGEGE
jgi:hypothetical protein